MTLEFDLEELWRREREERRLKMREGERIVWDRKDTCVVCRTIYSEKGQQVRTPWAVWGPEFQVCRLCVEAGRDARRRRERGE